MPENEMKNYPEIRDKDLSARCEVIARSATSWSNVFPGRKEVSKNVALIAKDAMFLARRDKKNPVETFEQARCQCGRTITVEQITLEMNKLMPEGMEFYWDQGEC